MALYGTKQGVQVLTTGERLQSRARAFVELREARRRVKRGYHDRARSRLVLVVGVIVVDIHGVLIRPFAPRVAFWRLERERGERVHECGHELEVRLERRRGEFGVARGREYDEIGDEVHLWLGLCKSWVGDYRGNGRGDEIERAERQSGGKGGDGGKREAVEEERDSKDMCEDLREGLRE